MSKNIAIGAVLFLSSFMATAEGLTTKAVGVNLNGNATQSAKLLEKVLLKELANGWEYSSYIQLPRENTDAKILIFTKLKTENQK